MTNILSNTHDITYLYNSMPNPKVASYYKVLKEQLSWYHKWCKINAIDIQMFDSWHSIPHAQRWSLLKSSRSLLSGLMDLPLSWVILKRRKARPSSPTQHPTSCWQFQSPASHHPFTLTFWQSTLRWGAHTGRNERGHPSGLSVSPGLSVHQMSPGPHHHPALPQSVWLKPPYLLPPSVPLWIAHGLLLGRSGISSAICSSIVPPQSMLSVGSSTIHS